VAVPTHYEKSSNKDKMYDLIIDIKTEIETNCMVIPFPPCKPWGERLVQSGVLICGNCVCGKIDEDNKKDKDKDEDKN
jgi:hypothetical protein